MCKIAVLILFAVSCRVAMAASYFPFSCIFLKIDQGDWYRNLDAGVKDPIDLNDKWSTSVFLPFTIGEKGSEFAAVCPGFSTGNGARTSLFVQVASGERLTYDHQPTCMLSGDNIKVTTQSRYLSSDNEFLIVRQVFQAKQTVELFFIFGVQPVASVDPLKCDAIFRDAVGVEPKLRAAAVSGAGRVSFGADVR